MCLKPSGENQLHSLLTPHVIYKKHKVHTDNSHWVTLTVDNYFSEFQADFMKQVILVPFLYFHCGFWRNREENSRAGKIRGVNLIHECFFTLERSQSTWQLHTSGQKLDSNLSSGTQHCAKVLKRRK